MEHYNVLVTILTDGEENASKEFSKSQIRKLIEELKTENWTFTYIGTDHDVTKITDELSINNIMTFSRETEDIEQMFRKEKMARFNYSNKIDMNMDVSADYFSDKTDEK